MPERIMLLFGGKKENEEQMDSGFGPFGLSRLAYETGGLYFTVHPNRKTGKFRPSRRPPSSNPNRSVAIASRACWGRAPLDGSTWRRTIS